MYSNLRKINLFHLGQPYPENHDLYKLPENYSTQVKAFLAKLFCEEFFFKGHIYSYFKIYTHFGPTLNSIMVLTNFNLHNWRVFPNSLPIYGQFFLEGFFFKFCINSYVKQFALLPFRLLPIFGDHNLYKLKNAKPENASTD